MVRVEPKVIADRGTLRLIINAKHCLGVQQPIADHHLDQRAQWDFALPWHKLVQWSAIFSRFKYSAMTGNEPTFCVSNQVLASMLGPPWEPSWFPEDAATPLPCHDQPAPKGAEFE